MIEDIRLTLSKNFFPLSQFDNNFKNTNYLTLKNLLKNVAIEVSKLFHNDDYYTEAYVGSGGMPFVPWVGLHSTKEGFDSEPNSGIYLTILWKADGSGVCLSLQVGTDKTPKNQILDSVKLVRNKYSIRDFEKEIYLNAPPKKKRPDNYQNAHIAGFSYGINDLNKIPNDLLKLEALYRAIIEDNPKIIFSNDKSNVSIIDNNTFKPTSNKKVLDKRTKEIRSYKNRKPSSGNPNPSKKIVETVQFERDPSVRADVLDRANGKCELCNNEAPFKKTDGDLYLEVHHIKQLAKGGPDTAINAVALCPNCHKEAHYGEKAEEIYVRLLANSTISPKTNPPPIRHQI